MRPRQHKIRPVQPSVVNSVRKTQNNEPCSCKSGLKYKHCCGKLSRLKEQQEVIRKKVQNKK